MGGVALTIPPTEVSAVFSQRPAPSSSMTVEDGCGRSTSPSPSAVSGHRMAVTVDASVPGTYLVRWRTVSVTDGHAAQGAFSFTVAGAPSGCSAPAPAGEKARHDPAQHSAHVASGIHGAHDYDAAASIAAAVAGAESGAPERSPSGRSPLVVPGGLAVAGLGLAPTLVRRLRRC
jgi:hypothetical protein